MYKTYAEYLDAEEKGKKKVAKLHKIPQNLKNKIYISGSRNFKLI